MENTYSFNEILDIWEKDEIIGKDKSLYLSKGFKTWREWRIDKMKNFLVGKDKWYKKQIEAENILNFRVGSFQTIYNYFKDYLDGNGNNYLKIEETKVINYEKLFLKNKEKIESIINNFPREVNFIGFERFGEIILIEGHHRAIAIARILNNSNKLNTDIKLNLYYHPVLEEEKVKNIDYIDIKDFLDTLL